MFKTLIITGCSKSKLTNSPDALEPADFLPSGAGARKAKETKMAGLDRLAYDMYTGKFYGNGCGDKKFKQGFNEFEKNFPVHPFCDLYILSAGYGLISPTQRIYPYDVTYNPAEFSKVKALGFKNEKAWGDQLNSQKDLNTIIGNYDLIIFFLSSGYLKALGINRKSSLPLKRGAQVLFFDHKEPILNDTQYHTYLTTEPACQAFNKTHGASATPYTIRGDYAYVLFHDWVNNPSNNKSDPFKIVYNNFDRLF